MSSSHTRNQAGDDKKTKADLILEINDLRDQIDLLTDELRHKDKDLDFQEKTQAQSKQVTANRAGQDVQHETLPTDHGELDREIKERKMAEEALLDKDATLRALFDTITESLILTDSSGVILAINDTAARSMGKAPEDLAGVRLFNALGAAGPGKKARADEVRLTGKPVRFEDIRNGRVVDQTIYPIFSADGQIARFAVFGHDITERKRAEDALRESEARFKSYFELPLVGIAIATPEKGIVNVNDKLCDILGYSADEFSAFTWDKLTHPDDLPRDLEQFYRMLGGEIDSYTLEKRFIHKNSSIIPTIISVGCVRRPDRTVDYVVTVISDISEHKHAKDALLESEDQFRKLFMSINEGFYTSRILYDDNGMPYDYLFIEVNPAFEKMMGMGRDQLIGRRFTELVPDHNSGWMDVFRKVALTGTPVNHEFYSDAFRMHFDTVAYRPTGEEFAALLSDVTERKLMEAALKKSDAQFKMLIKNLKSGVALVDESGRFAIVNPSFLTMFGLANDLDILNVNSLDWGRWAVYEEGGKKLQVDDHPVRKAAMTGRPVEGQIVGVKSPGAGEMIWMLISAEPVLKEDGRIHMIICTYNDVTRLKQAERELIEAKYKAELYLDLMGHDINNIHQVVMGYLELAQETMPANEDQRDLLRRPLEVLQRSTRLIDNVRKLQKLEEGAFMSKPVDVRQVLLDVMNEYRAIPGKTIALNDHGYGECTIMANELLYDVFSNLVGNAVKHSHENHACIAISLEKTQDRGIQYYRVSVEDDGPGIPDDMKDKIFNRMQRGTLKVKGLGIGLYLVKSLVDSYHGKVRVEDRVKGDHTKGARFVVILPLISH